MKVIFLDFDGVLNSGAWMQKLYDEGKRSRKTTEEIDPICVARVDRLARETGAVVVVSSTWRILISLGSLTRLLRAHGFTGHVVGKTPRLGCDRGHEIQEWLNDNHYRIIESFVILDDDSDMAHLKHKLVKTTFEAGLLDEHVEAAKKMLQEVEETTW